MTNFEPALRATEQAKSSSAAILGPFFEGSTVVVEAAPGSGKTNIIVASMEGLSKTLGDRALQAAAFNVAAANEIKGRCALLEGKFYIDTIQSILEQAFRCSQGDDWHQHRGLRRVSAPTREDILARALREVSVEVRCDERVVRRLRMRLEGKMPDFPEPGSLEDQVMLSMAKERRRRGLYDSWDVQTWVHKNPNLVVCYLREVREVGVLLVDEAQDLSRVEWGVITAWIEVGYQALVVGDTEQAINGFRGADEAGMARLIAEHRVEVVQLSITWRAREKLADFESRLRAGLFPGSPGLVACIGGGFGARCYLHRGTKERARRTVLAAVSAEVIAALGRQVPRSVVAALPSGYDASSFSMLTPLNLRDLAILVATNKEATIVAEALEDLGVPVMLLTARRPDPLVGAAARIVLNALDPWGKTSDYPGSQLSRGLRCLLYELAQRKGTRLPLNSPAGRALAQHLTELGQLEERGASALWGHTDSWLHAMEEDCGNGNLARYVTGARRVMEAIVTSRDDAEGTHHLIDEISAAYDLFYEGTSQRYAVAQYAYDSNQPPLGAARAVRRWPTASKANELPPLTEGAQRVVVAVMNQSKGLTFGATWVCALRPRTFPFQGEDSHAERCRFWVACTRATDLLTIHVFEQDKAYVDLAGPATVVGDPAPFFGKFRGSRRFRHKSRSPS
jgi:superfamily I DNA/RNA helicase